MLSKIYHQSFLIRNKYFKYQLNGATPYLLHLIMKFCQNFR